MSNATTCASEVSMQKTLSHMSLQQKRKLYDLLKRQQVENIKLRDAKFRAGRQSLVAFVAVKNLPDDKALFSQQLKQSLKDSLPDYAIPKKIFPVEIIPKLVSGKVDKSKLKQLALILLQEQQNAEPAIPAAMIANRSASAVCDAENSVQDAIVDAWSSVLGCQVSSPDDNFFALGGDSILSIHVVSRLLQAGYKVSPNDLFDFPTVAQFAKKLVINSSIDGPETQLPAVNQAAVTPIQSWFFETVTAHNEQWNMTRLFRLPQAVSDGAISDALDQLAANHDAFRISFAIEAGHYKQQLSAQADVSLQVIEVGIGPISIDVVKHKAALLQSSFNLLLAPLIRFTLFKTDCDRVLLVTAHHLVMDVVSLQILKQDLDYYLSCDNSKSLTQSAVFTAWAAYQYTLANDNVIKNQIDYWDNASNEASSQFGFDCTAPDSDCSISTEAKISIITMRLTAQMSQALKFDVHHSYQTTTLDILLSAFALAIQTQFARSQITIDIEAHGRFDPHGQVDLTRTIGWFSSVYPLRLSCYSKALSDDGLIAATVKTTKEKIKVIKHGGIAFGLLKQTNQLKKIVKLPSPRILFNYMGSDESETTAGPDDCPVTMLDVDIPGQRHSQNQRSHLIEIQAVFKAGQLHLQWHYDHDVIDVMQLQEFIECYHKKLQQIIVHCQQQQTGSYTPSDFPDAQLDQQALDDFLDSL